MLIVIPTYNRKQLVLQCLISVLDCLIRGIKEHGQRHKLVIVDNGSMDGTRAVLDFVCRSFRQYAMIDVELIPFARNFGKARAINAAVKKFGEGHSILCSYDSDLVIEERPTFFDDFEEMFRHVNADCAFDILCAEQTGNSVHDYRLMKAKVSTKYGEIRFHPKGRGIAGGCLVMGMAKFCSVGGYRTDLGVVGGNDGHLIDKVLKNGPSRRVGVAMDYRLHHPDEDDAGYEQYKKDAVARIQIEGFGTTQSYWS